MIRIARFFAVLLSLVTVKANTFPEWQNVDSQSRHDYHEDDILVIKTDSAHESEEKVAIRYEPTKPGGSYRQLYLYFAKSAMQYTINACTGYNTVIQADIPSQKNKTWYILRNQQRIIISCNDKEILNFWYKNGNTGCVETWSKIDEEFRFLSSDTASDQFRVLLKDITYSSKTAISG